MRPIGGVEQTVTMVAVRLASTPSEQLRSFLRRGSGANDVERKAARRVLRVRAVALTGYCDHGKPNQYMRCSICNSGDVFTVAK